MLACHHRASIHIKFEFCAKYVARDLSLEGDFPQRSSGSHLLTLDSAVTPRYCITVQKQLQDSTLPHPRSL